MSKPRPTGYRVSTSRAPSQRAPTLGRFTPRDPTFGASTSRASTLGASAPRVPTSTQPGFGAITGVSNTGDKLKREGPLAAAADTAAPPKSVPLVKDYSTLLTEYVAEKRHTYIRLTDRNTDLRLVPPDEIQSIHVNNELEPVDMPMGKIFRLKMEGDPFGYRTIHPVFFGTLDDKLRWLKDNGTFYAAYLSNTPKGTWFTCLLWHQKDSTDLLLHKDLQPRDENTRAKKKAGAISRPQNQLRPALAMVVDKKGYVKYTLVQNLLALALFQQSNKHVKTFT